MLEVSGSMARLSDVAAVRPKQGILRSLLCEVYGHPVTVHCFTWTSCILLALVVVGFFIAPLADPQAVNVILHRLFPSLWIQSLVYDWSNQYHAFVVDHLVALLAIGLPAGGVLLGTTRYSRRQGSRDFVLLALRIACSLVIVCSLVVVMSEFLSRRATLASICLVYGVSGLLYSWSVDAWRWYFHTARHKGLVSYLPLWLQHMLLRVTLLDWLTDTTLLDRVKHFLPFLLPLNKSEQARLLAQLPSETQTVLTRPGMVNFLPESVQRVLLPVPAHDSRRGDGLSPRDVGMQEEEQSQLLLQLPNDLSFEMEIPSSASAGFGFQHSVTSRVAPSSIDDEAKKGVINDIINQRLINTCTQLAQLPSARTLYRTSACSSALLVLQLYLSPKSRRQLWSVVRFLSLTSFGSVACLALLVRVLQLMNSRPQSMFLLRSLHRLLLQTQTTTQRQLTCASGSITNESSTAAENGQAQKQKEQEKQQQLRQQQLDQLSSTLTKATAASSAVVAAWWILRRLRR